MLAAALIFLGGAAACAQNASAELRVALLGTSLTKNGGWDKALEARLSHCLERPVKVLNFGAAGKTSRWGLTQVAKVRQAEPDIVAIEFSANDASLLKGFSIAESASNAEQIIRRLRQGERDPHIVLLAMNPMHGLRGWTRPWLDHYYDAYAPVAQRLGAEFLDFRPAWRGLRDTPLREFIPDGVHPTPDSAAGVVAPLLANSIAKRLAKACAAATPRSRGD